MAELREILADLVVDANIERAVTRLSNDIARRDKAIDIALNFIEQIAFLTFPDKEVNGEIIGEAQALISEINDVLECVNA